MEGGGGGGCRGSRGVYRTGEKMYGTKDELCQVVFKLFRVHTSPLPVDSCLKFTSRAFSSLIMYIHIYKGMMINLEIDWVSSFLS